MRRAYAGLLAAIVVALAAPAAAQAGFGIVPGSVTTVALNRDGSVDQQAGSHPYSYTVNFSLITDSEGQPEGGEPRQIIADLPPGLIGDPLIGPRCTRQQFEGLTPQCPASTQVGLLHIDLPGIGLAKGPLYNL